MIINNLDFAREHVQENWIIGGGIAQANTRTLARADVALAEADALAVGDQTSAGTDTDSRVINSKFSKKSIAKASADAEARTKQGLFRAQSDSLSLFLGIKR
ncbi:MULTISPECIES: hypothetical protein [unclassified Moorena]|uniref:hypothetical protein n=1 Tax=unclassified Moorena TaxID=2683338 RepID=UPI0013CA3E51|nr:MULTISPECIES: hypothetical protein [unclassified Moorena]NEO20159.1 hypothetical protein [Moorena sp. SIO4A5]NEP23778.1 hypothetical protein [Moorena sp. SIO3I6]NEQ59392.1 hypothetical protein [Moorena sp. SIO4A1]